MILKDKNVQEENNFLLENPDLFILLIGIVFWTMIGFIKFTLPILK